MLRRLPSLTVWSEIAARAGAPAGYLRDLPAPLVADCVNFGLKDRAIDEVGVLLYKNGGPGSLAAMTGPNYGRIWNLDLLQHMRKMFGDGLTGNWRIPGEFGKKIEYTKANTTMFMSDRDMFVFLADEDRRIEIPNRRAGMMGTFARGFFLKNSEVGSATLELWGFLYDYTCCNRNVWAWRESRRSPSGTPAARRGAGWSRRVPRSRRTPSPAPRAWRLRSRSGRPTSWATRPP